MDIACYKYHNQGPHLNAGGITIVLTGLEFVGGERIEIVIDVLSNRCGRDRYQYDEKKPIRVVCKISNF